MVRVVADTTKGGSPEKYQGSFQSPTQHCSGSVRKRRIWRGCRSHLERVDCAVIPVPLLFPLPPERFDTNCSLVLFKTARVLTLASVPRSLTTHSANTVGNASLLRLATGTRTCYTRIALYHALYLRHSMRRCVSSDLILFSVPQSSCLDCTTTRFNGQTILRNRGIDCTWHCARTHSHSMLLGSIIRSTTSLVSTLEF